MTSPLLNVPDAMTPPANWPPAEPLAIPTKYELDAFQKHAVLGIHNGDHVFVTAKTGSGKTFVGEYLIARALATGGRVFYTTPIKSLSNQKYHDLKKLFPAATVGILTGDIKMCPDAQIIVMTAEILRNLFYKRGTATEGVGVTATVSLEGVVGIVMDEVHYIQDPDRGHVWEETMILCPPNLQLVLLSATMPSATTLASWLADTTGRRTHLLSTTYRVVPLVHGVLDRIGAASFRVRPLLDVHGTWIPEVYSSWLRDRKALADSVEDHRRAVQARRLAGDPASGSTDRPRMMSPIHQLRETVTWLERTGKLPALFFVFSRKECERMAAQMEGSLIDSSDAAAATHIIDFHLSRHRATLEKSPQYHRIRDLLIRGIAFHHSGLQPLLKEIVEILFTRGYVKVLFATETFSVGLNMPTKTVIFLDVEKWCDGGQRRPLRPDEYIQMAGRAGRRGLDTEGLVLYCPFRDPVETHVLKPMMTGALPPLESRMRFHYDFLLRDRLTEGRIPIAERSYWAVQQRAGLSASKAEIKRLEGQLSVGVAADVLEKLAEKQELEAAVAGSVNAKRKKAQLALSRWMEEHWTPALEISVKRATQILEIQQERDRMAREVKAWEEAPLLALDPLESCLTKWGFLADGALTLVGQTATELNEGHPILMALLAESGRAATLNAEELASVLATFLQEGVEKENAPESLGLSTAALDVLQWIETTAQRCLKDEDAAGVHSPTQYWTISAVWPAIVSRWISGASLTEIAAEFDMFEGNVQRGLMRIANLLEEWTAVAQLRTDLATLEKLSAFRLLRDEIIVDSIYLRL
jgi:superfamily II RNA helicase